MFAWVAAWQPIVIGSVLVWAAGMKLWSRNAPLAARRSALPRLVGERRAPAAYRTVGIVELVLGSALLLPPVWRIESVAAVGLNAGFLAYLAYARLRAPESSCGCMSAQQRPIGVRGFVRAAVMLLGSIGAVGTGVAWYQTVSAVAVALALTELGLILALSSELDRYWLMPLRRLRAWLTHPLPTGATEVPLATTVELLLRSDTYRGVAAAIASDIREHWDEGDWRIICYSASVAGKPVSAVFAVPKLGNDPGAIRIALVEETSHIYLPV
jgi:hypothetical protein